MHSSIHSTFTEHQHVPGTLLSSRDTAGIKTSFAIRVIHLLMEKDRP